MLVDRLVRRLVAHRPDGLLDLRPRLLAPRAVLEGRRRHATCSSSTAPRSRTCVWRMLGVRIGRGSSTTAATITERSFVTIGDHCTLNAGSRHPMPLPGGRRVQVRPQPSSAPASRSGSAPSSITACTIGDGVRARGRLVPDEGRRGRRRLPVGRQPRHGARSSARQSAPGPPPRIAHRTRSGRCRTIVTRSDGACNPPAASTGGACSPQAAPPPSRAGTDPAARGRRSTWRRCPTELQRGCVRPAAALPRTPWCWPR